ncbi:ESPR domain-containing protein [Phascolarctobacterium succinatutens]|uniref:ESPR domain-containing protein n=1 Tax=Phascolarctobacterium succinatutens TaxID=626940 RepID=UPI0026C19A93|nr:ESPR domain-containing protein [Phascolarctobacterium succinatutens]
MNKVFKVIWSEARNAYVVVSEIAKNHGSKSCSTKKLLAMLIATGVMTCASMAPAMAADPPAEALKHSTVAAGYNITVTPKDNSDGGKEYNVDLKNDIYLQGDDPAALVSISGSKGTIWATGSVTVGSGVDGSVVMDGTTATVSGLSNKTTAYAGFANGKGKAATEEQLKEISEVAENANQGWNLSTSGGEVSKVAPGETVDFSGDQNINISNDGTDVKVELKNDIYLAGDDPNAFVNISGSKGTIWTSGSVTAGSVAVGTAKADGTTPFFVDSNGAFYAADGKFSVDKDGNANANSVQTNALNAKYNLSVGTANENGTVPFFVNSNGAFYAANGKLVVDKDGKLVAPEAELGKVTADEGVIGNVVLKDGVFYKNSALRDGELFVGDASGNYSQITTKGAKLGKVTIDEQGNIAGETTSRPTR